VELLESYVDEVQYWTLKKTSEFDSSICEDEFSKSSDSLPAKQKEVQIPKSPRVASSQSQSLEKVLRQAKALQRSSNQVQCVFVVTNVSKQCKMIETNKPVLVVQHLIEKDCNNEVYMYHVASEAVSVCKILVEALHPNAWQAGTVEASVRDNLVQLQALLSRLIMFQLEKGDKMISRDIFAKLLEAKSGKDGPNAQVKALKSCLGILEQLQKQYGVVRKTLLHKQEVKVRSSKAEENVTRYEAEYVVGGVVAFFSEMNKEYLIERDVVDAAGLRFVLATEDMIQEKEGDK
jgi:hypothetical protein